MAPSEIVDRIVMQNKYLGMFITLEIISTKHPTQMNQRRLNPINNIDNILIFYFSVIVFLTLSLWNTIPKYNYILWLTFNISMLQKYRKMFLLSLHQFVFGVNRLNIWPIFLILDSFPSLASILPKIGTFYKISKFDQTLEIQLAKYTEIWQLMTKL